MNRGWRAIPSRVDRWVHGNHQRSGIQRRPRRTHPRSTVGRRFAGPRHPRDLPGCAAADRRLGMCQQFSLPHRPGAISPRGRNAAAFRKAIHDLIEGFRESLLAIFESDDCQKRCAIIEQPIHGKNEHAFAALNEKAPAMKS